MALGLVAAPEARAALQAAREPLALVLIALALLGALSVLWTLGPDERTLRWAAVTLGYAAIFCAAAVAARDRGGRVALAAGIGAIAGVSAALALVAAALHEEPYAVRIGGHWRAAGPLEYPPALALLMVCALPAFLEAARARMPMLKVAGATGLALSASVLVLAQSRVGLTLGLLVVALAVYRAMRRPAIVVIGVAVAVVAASFAFGPGDGPESGFLHGREDTWSAAVDTFSTGPCTGPAPTHSSRAARGTRTARQSSSPTTCRSS